MKSKLVMRKAQGALWPANDFARETLRGIPDGKLITVSAQAPRNPKQLALYQMILSKLIDCGAWEGSRRELSRFILRKTGYVDVTYRKGQPEIEYRDIGFESMTQREFNDFFTKAQDIIRNELLEGSQWDVVRAELFDRQSEKQ